MKQEFENKIIDKFPELFYYFNHTESRYPMMFGIETGEGWHDLIFNTCQKIQDWCDKNRQIRFTQIKEKFGALVIYCEGYPDEVDYIIEEAEKESMTICENCGSKENVKPTRGWINYLCDTCHKIKNKNKK